DFSAAGPGGAEVRACVEDEHGDVTSTDVPDVEAEFCTVYEGDSDGLSRAVSEHPTREAPHRALEDGEGAGEGQAAESGVGRSGRLECSAGASGTGTQHGRARRLRCPLDGDRV